MSIRTLDIEQHSRGLDFIRNFQEHEYLRNKKKELVKLYFSLDPKDEAKRLLKFYDTYPNSDVPTIESLGLIPLDLFLYYDGIALEVVKLCSKELAYDACFLDIKKEKSRKKYWFLLPWIFGIVIALIVTFCAINNRHCGTNLLDVVCFIALPFLLTVYYSLALCLLYCVIVFIQRSVIRFIVSRKVKYARVGVVNFLDQSQANYLKCIKESQIDNTLIT